ncbi:MAG: excinuclease ABC subunit UvrC [Methanobacteriaceae archaeon]|nr:excinuclease ABC subunit UvrC [Methanobacteriaceae archaeon]
MPLKITNPEVLPQTPGVYIMHNNEDKIIYIGKAKKLRNRVKSYFKDKLDSPKTEVLMTRFSYLEYVETETEKEALILEANLIKKYKPQYNIQLKDGRSYPYIKINYEKYPRLQIAYKINNKKAKYYGPYTDVTRARQLIDYLNKTFQLRTCKNMDGPCLNYQIKQCSAPCKPYITQKEYKNNVKNIEKVLEGKHDQLITKLEKEMKLLADKQRYEEARIIRDQIDSLKITKEKQKIQITQDMREDIIAFTRTKNKATVVVISLVKGVTQKPEDLTLTGVHLNNTTEILTEFVKQYYNDKPAPTKIIIPEKINDKKLITDWLEEKQNHPVIITTPEETIDEKLVKMAKNQSKLILNQEKDIDEKPLLVLKQYLNLPKLPYHIEAFDISNISGIHAVASMVVFEDGKPNKKKYRRFKMKTPGPNDFAMMKEVLTRRYSHISPLFNEEKTDDSIYDVPDLILIDGGKGQLGMAVEVLNELGLTSIPAVGIAKKFEELFVPYRSDPIIIPRQSKALHILEFVRDESHRFAITYHRTLRKNAFTKSILDTIPGIGKKRKQALLTHFKNMDNIYDATIDELKEVKSITNPLAETIYETLKKDKKEKNLVRNSFK